MSAQPEPRDGHARSNGDGRFHSSPYSASQAGNPAAHGNYAEASVGDLLKQLMREGGALVTNEVALAKSEARDAMEQTREGAMAVSAGGLVAFSGFIVLLLAAVYGLSTVMAPWAAALIVGGVVTVIGAVMLQAGRRKFTAGSLRPEHTMRSLHKDREAIRGRTNEYH